MHDNIDFHTSKIVDGYRKAFIDSGYESDPEYSPSLITNSSYSGCDNEKLRMEYQNSVYSQRRVCQRH